MDRMQRRESPANSTRHFPAGSWGSRPNGTPARLWQRDRPAARGCLHSGMYLTRKKHDPLPLPNRCRSVRAGVLQRGRRIQRHGDGDSTLHGATCERFTGFCSDGSMANSDITGLEGWNNDAPEYASQRAVRPSSPWSQLEWLTCSDGKSRATQPGIFPLVDGISKSVVRGGDRSMAPDANQSAEARTMRLKGYGNAIVPQIAALFITAAMQSI